MNDMSANHHHQIKLPEQCQHARQSAQNGVNLTNDRNHNEAENKLTILLSRQHTSLDTNAIHWGNLLASESPDHIMPR